MSGLLALSSDDFSMQQGVKGNVMCTQIPGLSLIFFYSVNCAYCKPLMQEFKKLPGTIGGCQFGIINIGQNIVCAKMSQNTIAPITYVPYIMFYVNGRPYMIYKGPAQVEEMRKFILDIAKQIQSTQQFMGKKQEPQQEIPIYGGKPLYGNEKVCYLDFSHAYGK